MASKPRVYTGQQIDVTYETPRCIHAAECVRHLNAVFDTANRPWVNPDAAPADAVASAVEACPSGALHYARKDDGGAEQPDAVNSLRIAQDGPLYVRGDLTLQAADGTPVLTETRTALCRCGQSKNKPFCDNTHIEAGFKAGDSLAVAKSDPEAPTGGALTIKPNTDGSYTVEGNFSIHSSDGETVYQKSGKTWLCRCGQSSSKPFCDGTHKRVGFEDPGMTVKE
jgi:CDGSH-type Zn-finger protein/uncharacterized Fe-S cluster protein YjdI